jgi:DnaJ-class molecular chaperone
MSNAQCCPICGGTGKVLSTFYPDIPQTTGTQMHTTCRGCGGTGVITTPTTYPLPRPPARPPVPNEPDWSGY